MNLDRIDKILAELAVLIGGRIQRVDVIAPDELVVQLRCPGRTLNLMLVGGGTFARVHLVPKRPPRVAPGGALQGLLRKRLGGRPLYGLHRHERWIHLDVPGTRVRVRLGAGRPSIEVDDITRAHVEPVSTELPDHFVESEKLVAELAPKLSADRTERLRRALMAPLRARIKKKVRLHKRLLGDATRLEAMKDDAHKGELLKTSLHKMKRGMSRIEVTDWLTSEPVQIPLDPKLDPKANMNRFFARSKKASRGLPIVHERTRAVEAEIDALRAELDRINSEDLEALGARIDDTPERASVKTRKKAVDPADRWSRRFVTSDGFEVRVGKGAKENDRLTLSVAKGHHLWLHARGVPGAHVVLRVEKGKSPTQDALLDAAHLAVWYSSAKNAPKAEVIYTAARHVKKIKGAPPGQVSVAKEKTLLLRVDEARLSRLLDKNRNAPR